LTFGRVGDIIISRKTAKSNCFANKKEKEAKTNVPRTCSPPHLRSNKTSRLFETFYANHFNQCGTTIANVTESVQYSGKEDVPMREMLHNIIDTIDDRRLRKIYKFVMAVLRG
jgi:hypothetical protein